MYSVFLSFPFSRNPKTASGEEMPSDWWWDTRSRTRTIVRYISGQLSPDKKNVGFECGRVLLSKSEQLLCVLHALRMPAELVRLRRNLVCQHLSIVHTLMRALCVHGDTSIDEFDKCAVILVKIIVRHSRYRIDNALQINTPPRLHTHSIACQTNAIWKHLPVR